MQLIFDTQKVEKQTRTRTSYVIYDKICNIIKEDLPDIFFIYQINPRTFFDFNPLDNNLKHILEKIGLKEEKEKVDLITSFMNLHKLNNITEIFENVKNNLNKNGLFIGSFFGLSNLYSLGKILAENDIKENGVPFPRMLPLIDIKTFGMLLQKTGFRNPVVYSINFEQNFISLKEALQFLRSEGETNCLLERDKTFLSANILKKLLANFTNSFNLQFNICFFSCIL